MSKFACWIGLLLAIGCCTSCREEKEITRDEVRILAWVDSATWVSARFRETWAELEAVSAAKGWTVEPLRDLNQLEEDSLKRISALLWWDSPIESMSVRQMTDVERFVQMGGGLLAVNCTFERPLSWPWWEKTQAAFRLVEQPSTMSLAQPVADVVVEREARQFPYPQVAFHRLTSWVTFPWEKALSQAIGTNTYRPSSAASLRVPEESRFTIKVLDSVMIEPMELAILPDGKVIYIERRGRMKMYLPQENRTRIMHEFDVCTEGNYEDGMLGLTIDPHFEENHYLYLYYSPGSACAIQSQYLSRFTMIGDSINLASEKVILEVPVQRETCCHSGGSLTWDTQGNLYLSTGDNTSSKESDGYSPLDERPGRGPYDSQKSSSNTHDLRGKILRIRPNRFGSYDIPDGNLFPKDGSEGRPEIYVMGARNPFRIAVDPKNGYVYWGDVGPDVGHEGKYGPESFDEWNQARTPGNYGWPYFVGDNFSYRVRDFDADTVGDYFNPSAPVNTSPHNTGRKQLPPARPALIWYAKGPSAEFPQVGVGSNSAMSGPVYYPDLYPASSESKFPDYFEGKWFIYEWARSWIQVVTFDEAGELARIEPFLPNWEMSKPIDMEFGPDGAMYVLEYGQNYFADNPDARLVRIEYAAGNRKPVAKLQVDQVAGAAPLAIQFSAAGSFDYDEGDSLHYFWNFGDGTQASGLNVSHVFNSQGVYSTTLQVVDRSGARQEERVEITVGNARPNVHIAWKGNRSFYFSRNPIPYQVTVDDPEDQAIAQISLSDILLRSVYLPDARLLTNMTEEEALSQAQFAYQTGKQLIQNSDCASCHALKVANVGPTYYAIAERYRHDFDMVGYLANKIILGGNGNWGEKIMAGHPQLSLDQASDMVRYILSLDENQQANQLPAAGQFPLRDHVSKPGGAYLLVASYTDRGANGMAALTGKHSLLLRDPLVQAESYDMMKGLSTFVIGPDRDMEVVAGFAPGNWMAFRNWDLSGVAAFTCRLLPDGGGKISVRLGSPEGKIIGEAVVPKGSSSSTLIDVNIPLSPYDSFADVYFVAEPGAAIGPIDWIRVIPSNEGARQ